MADAQLCRYPSKKLFTDEDSAFAGAEAIRAKVEASGGTYDQLYPYQCPGADHWHLSSKRQGTATCPICFDNEAPAWFGGEVWVIGAHEHAGEPCQGSGAHAQDERLGSARAALSILGAVGGMDRGVLDIFAAALDGWEGDISALVLARRRANAAEREVERLRVELAQSTDCRICDGYGVTGHGPDQYTDCHCPCHAGCTAWDAPGMPDDAVQAHDSGVDPTVPGGHHA
ncbi:hypothetical protein ACT17_32695 [Mycolicibacterium conceptionense]|uniref:Uncharacterized protein n=1 Tax=Mycolicibacterium conceptionense TaxID=451644 RepID=A0A0J8TWY1_9MYCO|nr:hypothetical protein [Mycolicibacterium conceptionense]KMV13941.1 hypothetical protein ACT17_32695 [Mycolicibacterium conceptionense]